VIGLTASSASTSLHGVAGFDGVTGFTPNLYAPVFDPGKPQTWRG